MFQFTERNPRRVLPAPLYDALQQSAAKHGGIGAGAFTDVHAAGRPLCIYGHALALTDRPHQAALWRAWHEFKQRLRATNYPLWLPRPTGSYGGWAAGILDAFGISPAESDETVRRTLWATKPYGFAPGSRITWEQWCAAMHVTRAQMPSAAAVEHVTTTVQPSGEEEVDAVEPDEVLVGV